MNQDVQKCEKFGACSPPESEYGFFGRKAESLKIENEVLKQNNMLLVQAASGAGKTALLSHIARCWQADGRVEKVFYFSFHERLWNLEEILPCIADSLFPEKDQRERFQNSADKASMIAESLGAHKCLLILEDLEFISNHPLSPGLSKNERRRLKSFLTLLSNGAARVLLSSQDSAPWLSSTTFKDNVFHLDPLDAETARMFCEKILEKHGWAAKANDEKLQRLIALLKQSPLALGVVIPDLAVQTPDELIIALGLKDVVEPSDAQPTIDAVEFLFRTLPHGKQRLMACLAPLKDVINPEFLPQYGQHLKKQKPLENLDVDEFIGLIKEVFRRRLILPHRDVPEFFQLRPPMPYLLEKMMRQLDPGTQEAIQAGFVVHYGVVCWSIAELLKSKEENKPQIGFLLTRIEYQNILAAMQLALERQVSILAIFGILHQFIENAGAYRQGLGIGETILLKMGTYSQETMTGPVGAEFVSVMRCIAQYHLGLENYEGARQFYQKALDLHMALEFLPQDQKIKASVEHYYLLGATAQRQRLWQQAENYYQQAADVCARFNDRPQLAGAYRRLAVVAQEQNQWRQADELLQKAMDIVVECNDRPSEARIYRLMGVGAEEQKDWNRAEKCCQKALEIDIEIKDSHAQADAYHQLGSIAQEQQQWKKAEGCFQKAMDIFVACNDRLAQGKTCHHLGTIAQEQRHWRKADSYYEKALNIFVALDDLFLQAGTYQNMAIAAQRRELWPQAGTFFLKSLECFAKSNDQQNTLLALNSLFHLNELAEVKDMYSAIARILERAPDEIQTIHDLWKAEM